ncbi:MAG TPA: hypothetical protein VGF60_04285 [Xanthobacteraceae bacterium]|jgi:hypothetical protein
MRALGIAVVLLAICSFSAEMRAQGTSSCKECREQQQACLKNYSGKVCKNEYDICIKACRKK